MILKGDCIKVMKAMKPNSVDAIVTDPPYGLVSITKRFGKTNSAPLVRESFGKGNSPHIALSKGFMGKEWDGINQVFHTQWLTEAYRVLKPGGSMLVMGGTRTFHRLACAIEDSGFIIKDTLMWLYGSGFPKAQDLGKMIDKRGGNGKEWDGLKVGGIKPAYEPIIWAVKPPEGSYIENVLKWGVGAVNVEECRIGYISPADKQEQADKNPHTVHADNEIYGDYSMCKEPWKQPKGRFPANVILDEEAARMLDEQSGELKGKGQYKDPKGYYNTGIFKAGYDDNKYANQNGGASRFFYTAKASKSERNRGLDDSKNNHPTVKPTALFEWLIKLVTREGQIILDPFLGSGTTAISAHNIGRKCIGIEREDEYLTIARKRVKHWEREPKQKELSL